MICFQNVIPAITVLTAQCVVVTVKTTKHVTGSQAGASLGVLWAGEEIGATKVRTN